MLHRIPLASGDDSGKLGGNGPVEIDETDGPLDRIRVGVARVLNDHLPSVLKEQSKYRGPS